MLKISLLMTLILIISCGSKKSNGDSKSQLEEAELGIGETAFCQRARLVRGTNAIYNWEAAVTGNLQSITILREKKLIRYQEAREGEAFAGEAPYTFASAKLDFFFKTTSKSLRLRFKPEVVAAIENAEQPQDFVLATLNYADGSGFVASFLCPKI